MVDESVPAGRAGRAAPALVSVIIPARDSAVTLGEQLDALAGQTYTGAWELVLADNGSSDQTTTIARACADRFGSLRVVDASRREGSAHARNVGASAATGDLLCFVDADDVATPGWLAALVAAASDADIVGGRLDTTTINDAHVQRWRPTPVTATNEQPRFAPSGNMAIWRDAFASLDGFNEDYLKSHDVELSRRAVADGLHIGFAPDALVHYRLRDTVGGLAKQAYRGGRATAQMAASFPEQIDPPSPRALVALGGWVLLRVPYLASRARRGVWVRQAAELAGTVVGCARYRPGRAHAGGAVGAGPRP